MGTVGYLNIGKRDETPLLGKWVSIQRYLFKKKLLPQDRQIQLVKINFTWKLQESGKRYNDELWNGRYEMLPSLQKRARAL
jgi:uncharacterized protein (DUF608 family)